ncbi:MAG: cyclic nucleotide-binding domain-containing protein [Betaproteobacteria bacterium]|nr:cyclic nucleotide-binding domain-containing protein [Betaproteobacteria bacterium]MDH4324407.1 cyclic nucleotide-binding domain-containing protein [Betaproteobacteria bacterium]MDH5210294.1 cyclic nucleotide-binding domain-containing protein [Betaproteobacteria bacterium]
MSTGDAPRPFLERLDDAARNALLSVARPVSFARGARLVRAGEASRGAYVLREGEAEASVVLPGGERLSVARLGPGSLFGEMALFERGTATATVTASANVDGWYLDRDEFRALAAQRSPEAQRVRHALTLVLAHKLRAMNAKVLEVAAPEDRPAATAAIADPLDGIRRSKKSAFDFKPFLALLPVFEGFDDAEIAEVLEAARLLELPRGHGVFSAGQPSAAAFVVLRGAVEILASHAQRTRRMALLGPGQLFGFMSLLEGTAHGSTATVREAALLAEMPRAAFDALYAGGSAASTALHHAIQRSLLASLAQTNRHLTRLISLARLRGARREGDKLESALGGQIVAAPATTSSAPAA